MANKLTDAELMTGFNPTYAKTAEEIEAEAQQAGAEAEGTEPEGEEGESPSGDESGERAVVAPDLREVTLDGREFKAPRELADAFTREINRRDGTRGAELQTLRERLARLEGAATTKTPEGGETRAEGPQLPDPELQIENPAQYQKDLVAYVEHQQTLRAEALAQRYEEAEAAKDRETARRAAWSAHVDAFYAAPDNAVLRENKDIVDLVLEQNRGKLADLSVEDGFKELSRLAKERLARVTGQAPEVKARATPRPPVLEGSARRDSALRPAPAKDEGPRSLTQALKERRRAAVAAFAKGGAPRAVTSR